MGRGKYAGGLQVMLSCTDVKIEQVSLVASVKFCEYRQMLKHK